MVISNETRARIDAEIAKYHEIQDEVATLPSTMNILWLKVDCKPLKSSISNWVSKWTYKYTEYLSNDVTTKVEELLKAVQAQPIKPPALESVPSVGSTPAAMDIDIEKA